MPRSSLVSRRNENRPRPTGRIDLDAGVRWEVVAGPGGGPLPRLDPSRLLDPRFGRESLRHASSVCSLVERRTQDGQKGDGGHGSRQAARVALGLSHAEPPDGPLREAHPNRQRQVPVVIQVLFRGETKAGPEGRCSARSPFLFRRETRAESGHKPRHEEDPRQGDRHGQGHLADVQPPGERPHGAQQEPHSIECAAGGVARKRAFDQVRIGGGMGQRPTADEPRGCGQPAVRRGRRRRGRLPATVASADVGSRAPRGLRPSARESATQRSGACRPRPSPAARPATSLPMTRSATVPANGPAPYRGECPGRGTRPRGSKPHRPQPPARKRRPGRGAGAPTRRGPST